MNKEKWIQRAAEKGLEGFEIYESFSTGKDVTWFEGQMDSFTTSRTSGISLRGIKNGKAAYLAMEASSDEEMDEVLDSLISQAELITSDDKVRLMEPMDTELVNKDIKWVKPDMNLVYKVMKEIEEKIMAYDSRFIQVAYLAWSEAGSRREIVNSKSLNISDSSEFQAIVCSAAASENGEVQDDMLVKIVPDLKDFNVDAFVKELCDNTLGKLGAKPAETKTYPIILEKNAMTQLFTAFTGLFSGDLISKGISPLQGKLGEKVFSDKITIVDDPKNLDAFSVTNYDDEGYPTKRKLVVDHGVFETILHSLKTADKMGMEPTGNGFKSSYASSIGVTPFNMYIEPGDRSLKELEKEMKNGLVITDLAGLHAGIDFVSANFSLQCSGYLLENGEKKRPVSLITAAGNFIELMNKVVSVGNDLDWKYYTVCAPSIYFSECAVSGE